jgi:hypothetical protein
VPWAYVDNFPWFQSRQRRTPSPILTEHPDYTTYELPPAAILLPQYSHYASWIQGQNRRKRLLPSLAWPADSPEAPILQSSFSKTSKPGEAPGVSFHQTVSTSTDSITLVHNDMTVSVVFQSSLHLWLDRESTNCAQFTFKGAHFLTGNIAAFDAEFFSMSAAESNSTDVQQRILLEVAYEAVENGRLMILPQLNLGGL